MTKLPFSSHPKDLTALSDKALSHIWKSAILPRIIWFCSSEPPQKRKKAPNIYHNKIYYIRVFILKSSNLSTNQYLLTKKQDNGCWNTHMVIYTNPNFIPRDTLQYCKLSRVISARGTVYNTTPVLWTVVRLTNIIGRGTVWANMQVQYLNFIMPNILRIQLDHFKLCPWC